MKPQTKIFISTRNFEEASLKCRVQGFTPTGMARNKQGHYVIFGRK